MDEVANFIFFFQLNEKSTTKEEIGNYGIASDRSQVEQGVLYRVFAAGKVFSS